MSPERVVVLENGVDLTRFPDPVSRERTGRVGVVANLRPVKGLDFFVRAAAIVSRAQPRATFHIAGEGPLRSALNRMAADLGLTDRLALHGSVAEIPAFLADLEIGVLPSLSEGMSNALLEYMAAGRPIVATAVGANTRLIEDGISGLLVPPGDVGALGAAIDRLLAEPGLAARLGAAARGVAEQRYGRLAMVRRFEAYYSGLLAA
jgi:glycosyltransferase involved in cell wall biosynthesis